MILEEKKEYILNKLNKEKILRIEDLSRELNCTTASIRYIVNDLAKNNMLKRVYGGITKAENIVTDLSIKVLETKNSEKKEYIAEKALKEISGNSTIILDSGSTNMILAQKITGFSNLNIITNSIDIANILIDRKDINIIIMGGIIRPITHSVVGFNKENYIKSLNADKLFLNAGAFSLADGVTDPNFQEAIIKEDMISSAKEIILLADSTKCGKISIARICPMKKINKLITDREIDRDFVNAASKLGVELIF